RRDVPDRQTAREGRRGARAEARREEGQGDVGRQVEDLVEEEEEVMQTTRLRTALVLTSLLAAAACSPAEPPKAPAPPAAAAPAPAPAPPERESPPPSGAAREFRIPRPVWQELPNGLKIATVQTTALPIVQIRVEVLGGKAADGEKPGAMMLTGEMLK